VPEADNLPDGLTVKRRVWRRGGAAASATTGQQDRAVLRMPVPGPRAASSGPGLNDLPDDSVAPPATRS
jgi:hypothetical protein